MPTFRNCEEIEVLIYELNTKRRLAKIRLVLLKASEISEANKKLILGFGNKNLLVITHPIYLDFNFNNYF